ncbi:hypothetical protein BSL78_03321 [Apostichopus japonicus]|uniref:Fibronectin type-III domain-containing protein n=1 Tax=Stichopus japonicus TaxID=307972 RepID=A0A2G8LHM0_STIJA|nr:hypothetical protein BSL78_03321 [Apostichopus japonicus]
MSLGKQEEQILLPFSNPSIICYLYSKNDVIVPSCVNLTTTTCNLLEIFPTIKELTRRDLNYFKVTAISDVRDSFRGFSTKTFSKYRFTTSAPIITKIKVGSRNATVTYQGPETHYAKRSGQKLIMVEKTLLNQRIENIYFNWSLFKVGGPYKIRSTEPQRSKNGFGKADIASLEPYTNYIIKVRGRLHSKFSATAAEQQFRTLQEAPEFGPTVLGHNVIRRNCDLRDVTVSWKIRYDEKIKGPLSWLNVTYNSTVRNAAHLSLAPSIREVTLRDLSRWNNYDVIITSANTGGRRNGEVYTIDEDDHHTKSYLPTIQYVTRTSESDFVLMWKPPKNHLNCITGYDVKTSIGDKQEVSVTVNGPNTTMVALHFQRTGRYHISVSPNVHDRVKTVVSTSISYDVENPKRSDLLLVGIILILLVITILAVFITAKKLCCDMSRIPDFSLTKPVIQIFSDRPMKLRSPPEKEIFHRPLSSEDQKHAFNTTEISHSYASQEEIDVFEESPIKELDMRSFQKEGDLIIEEVLTVDIPKTFGYVRHCLMSTESSDSGFWTAPYDGSFVNDGARPSSYESIPTPSANKWSSPENTTSGSTSGSESSVESNQVLPPTDGNLVLTSSSSPSNRSSREVEPTSPPIITSSSECVTSSPPVNRSPYEVIPSSPLFIESSNGFVPPSPSVDRSSSEGVPVSSRENFPSSPSLNRSSNISEPSSSLSGASPHRSSTVSPSHTNSSTCLDVSSPPDGSMASSPSQSGTKHEPRMVSSTGPYVSHAELTSKRSSQCFDTQVTSYVKVDEMNRFVK